MMKFSMKSFGLGLVVVAAVCTAIAAQEAFTLKRVAKVGDTLVYKFTADADFAGTPITVSGTTTDKVVKVEDSGNLHVETAQGTMKVRFGDQEMDIPEQPSSTSIYDAAGRIVDIKGDMADSNAYRMANMSTFLRPKDAVKVGDKWSETIKGDTKKGTLSAKADYEILSVEDVAGHKTVKVKFSFKETEGPEPASSEGSVWISTADGSMVKLIASLIKAPLPGAPAPADMKITIERTK